MLHGAGKGSAGCSANVQWSDSFGLVENRTRFVQQGRFFPIFGLGFSHASWALGFRRAIRSLDSSARCWLDCVQDLQPFIGECSRRSGFSGAGALYQRAWPPPFFRFAFAIESPTNNHTLEHAHVERVVAEPCQGKTPSRLFCSCFRGCT